MQSAEFEAEVVMTCATHHSHKEKTPQGKALMDAYAARLKDIKADFSMRCSAKNREYSACMLYMYADIHDRRKFRSETSDNTDEKHSQEEAQAWRESEGRR